MTKVTEQAKTDFSNHLWRTYNWFSTVFTEKVRESCAEFFGLDIYFRLFALSENENVLIKGDQYFVTQIATTKNLISSVRLSKYAVRSLLDEALGKKQQPFVFEKMSELEAKILTSFNDFLYSNIKKVLIPKEDIDKKAMPKSICNVVYYMNFEGRDFGKLVLSIPTNLIQPEFLQCNDEIFSLYDFRTCEAKFKVKVGSSKIRLGEVKSLQVDDIILLENSNIYKMVICNEGEELEFKISPDPSIILNADDEGEDMAESPTSVSNLWDNIQVDINAEFEKVKISLGELKQISEGLVVDIGSIYDNRIDLKVEDKLVAKGELVIINDRYGVRIDEVIREEDEMDEVIGDEEISQDTGSDEEINEEEFEDDDFNYDDFEEDDNI